MPTTEEIQKKREAAKEIIDVLEEISLILVSIIAIPLSPAAIPHKTRHA
jgi:hypothetical protein